MSYATQLPPCPSCNLHALRENTVGGFTCYACNNEQCEHFPSTAYHANEQDARAEWLQIASKSQLPETQ